MRWFGLLMFSETPAYKAERPAGGLAVNGSALAQRLGFWLIAKIVGPMVESGAHSIIPHGPSQEKK